MAMRHPPVVSSVLLFFVLASLCAIFCGETTAKLVFTVKCPKDKHLQQMIEEQQTESSDIVKCSDDTSGEIFFLILLAFKVASVDINVIEMCAMWTILSMDVTWGDS